jgi:hypothetical protein
MGKTEKRRGEHGGAHLGQQMTRQTAVTARGGRVAPSDSSDGGGSTWGSSGYKKTMESFAKTSSSSSQLQLWWAAAEDDAWQRWLGQRRRLSLGPKYAWYRALFIGVLDRIIDNKNSNTFLVWIKLYLTKIQKESRRGWIQVRYDNSNRIFSRVSAG